jgi:hypothetical protein
VAEEHTLGAASFYCCVALGVALVMNEACSFNCSVGEGDEGRVSYMYVGQRYTSTKTYHLVPHVHTIYLL